MVGPSTDAADRRRFARRIRVGFALLVGASMALVALYGDAALAVVGGAFALGTAPGGALAWYAAPDTLGAKRLE
jgi:hypothetical protein